MLRLFIVFPHTGDIIYQTKSPVIFSRLLMVIDAATYSLF